MPPLTPKITKVIRTAEDWPVWLTQVNSQLLSLDIKQFLSINEDGGLELNPPRPPIKPSGGGPPDKRVSLPAEHGMLQWPQDGEQMEHLKMRNEYQGFMLEIERSISRDIGFDVEKERGFGELIQELRAHLGMDGGAPAVPVAHTEDQWNSLMQKDLNGI